MAVIDPIHHVTEITKRFSKQWAWTRSRNVSDWTLSSRAGGKLPCHGLISECMVWLKRRSFTVDTTQERRNDYHKRLAQGVLKSSNYFAYLTSCVELSLKVNSLCFRTFNGGALCSIPSNPSPSPLPPNECLDYHNHRTDRARLPN